MVDRDFTRRTRRRCDHFHRAAGQALVCVFSMLGFLALAAPASADSLSDRFGYTWLEPYPTGIEPDGLAVYVKAGRHTSQVVAATRHAVFQQRRYGIPLVYSGFTRDSTLSGAVVVHEGGNCFGSAGYGLNHYYPVPGLRRVGEVTDGEVRLCGGSFGSGYAALRAELLHELGHVVGLGHVVNQYDGRLQIMYPLIQAGDSTYQAGDANGLRAIAANTRAIAQALLGGGLADQGTPGGQSPRAASSAWRSATPRWNRRCS